jgi:hypothetical protein
MSSSHNDRQRELDNVIKQSNIKTDEFIKREDVKLRQFYEDKFKQELIMYQECEKLGDFIQAHYHITMAERIDDFLKTFER